MAVFVRSVSGVLIILVMIGLGYILSRRGWFDEQSRRLIARLVTQIALPAYMISTITTQFSAATLKATLPDLRFPVVSMLIMFGLSVIAFHGFKVHPKRRGLFEAMFANSNTVFVGLPVNEALFGPKSMPFVLVYYMANTTFFWTLGAYLIQRDGQGSAKFDLVTTLKKIFSPPLLGFMLGVALVLLDIQLPAWIMKDFSYVGGLTVPLSMIFIGTAIAGAGVQNIRLNRDSLGILFGRFLVAPTLMACLVIPTPMPILMKQVFILQAAMPVMTNAPVVAKLYRADTDYAAIMVTETTLLSLVVIPILMVIVQQIH
ncbi:AEC family transporter [Levilactobacillus tujiorum]|uniref:AEC family transporter n=1 Tax=Levilactobacillus tujiorum TaxID=2912243 RepID=A0ABX1L6I6_9LACO|nr:AEC family transporter [Levilactobacillus tujiorum]MCH5464881.1 AEC family transporter [Levilactobacillus tujiorum]NLR11942.1 AEC family transporter [Lactobacillus sp. HBUAS51387]NLR29916.1 AEC family transporter [Levilactobacillus tujiorum]NLR31421.1 AEC family transporter [Levilactobacillus tujiorum]